jgi:hypothetical protein
MTVEVRRAAQFRRPDVMKDDVLLTSLRAVAMELPTSYLGATFASITTVTLASFVQPLTCNVYG